MKFMRAEHLPVLLNEVLAYLKVVPGGNYIDCTFGGGGYSVAITKKTGPAGMVLAIDADNSAILKGRKFLRQQQIGNVILRQGNFKDIAEIADKEFKKNKIREINGIVFDLGMSSMQVNDRKRGFSFRFDTELDMRFFSKQKLTAFDIVNYWSEKDIAKILKEYGEERYFKSIACGIAKERKKNKIKTTFELIAVIKKYIPTTYLRQKKHFATRVFQALRIAVNNEMENLQRALPQALNILSPGGRLLVVSFHSLEDRIVKNFFRQEAKDCLCSPQTPICVCNHRARLKIITKKAIFPTQEEIRENPRARSGRLRVAEKIN